MVIIIIKKNKKMSSNFLGVIIGESLENREVLEKVKIVKTIVEKVTEKHKTPWLDKWTIYKVEVGADKVAKVAEELSRCLESKHNWYADFKNDKFHFIIFKGKVFRVDITSKEQYTQAKNYGISVGIPEYQMDFRPGSKEWER